MPDRLPALADLPALVERLLAGDRLALARLLTYVENDADGGRAVLDSLFPYTGRAHLVGVTGSPGTGKSSLVNQLARHYRRKTDWFTPRKVAVIAVDPSSPFTGGAVLGDRVRMRELVGDPGVFIRSMASRGALGGLAAATSALVQVFDAAGYEIIFIETVGAGQSEVDIARLAHTTIVVEAPGLGDDIQAIKAGILEVADILVVNKADRQGADSTLRALRSMLELAHPSPRLYFHDNCLPMCLDEDDVVLGDADEEIWKTPVIPTIATMATGTDILFKSILDHEAYLHASNEWKRRERMRIQAEFSDLLQDSLVRRWRQGVGDERFLSVLSSLVSRELSPIGAVGELLADTEKIWARTREEYE